MSKRIIGRNDPCFCGSGKKYKKCCGAPNPNVANPVILNNELNRLHQQLLSFATENYGEKINEQAKRFDQPALQRHPELMDIYYTGLNLWIISKLKIIKNVQTILELFFQVISSKLNPIVKRLFSQWLTADSSIYKVITVPAENKDMVELQDVLTNKRFRIPFRDQDEYIEGSLVIGTLVPFSGYHAFLLSIIKLYGIDHNSTLELMERFAKMEGGISGHFPELLTEALLLSVKNEELNPLHERVAQEFTDHMVEKEVEDAVILQGLALWKQYCEKENPSFKNIEPYAAALDYYVQKNVLMNESTTQNMVANEYGANPSTVSNNYRKLANFLLKK